jgi:hypothetical protein
MELTHTHIYIPDAFMVTFHQSSCCGSHILQTQIYCCLLSYYTYSQKLFFFYISSNNHHIEKCYKHTLQVLCRFKFYIMWFFFCMMSCVRKKLMISVRVQVNWNYTAETWIKIKSVRQLLLWSSKYVPNITKICSVVSETKRGDKYGHNLSILHFVEREKQCENSIWLGAFGSPNNSFRKEIPYIMESAVLFTRSVNIFCCHSPFRIQKLNCDAAQCRILQYNTKQRGMLWLP